MPDADTKAPAACRGTDQTHGSNLHGLSEYAVVTWVRPDEHGIPTAEGPGSGTQ